MSEQPPAVSAEACNTPVFTGYAVVLTIHKNQSTISVYVINYYQSYRQNGGLKIKDVSRAKLEGKVLTREGCIYKSANPKVFMNYLLGHAQAILVGKTDIPNTVPVFVITAADVKAEMTPESYSTIRDATNQAWYNDGRKFAMRHDFPGDETVRVPVTDAVLVEKKKSMVEVKFRPLESHAIMVHESAPISVYRVLLMSTDDFPLKRSHMRLWRSRNALGTIPDKVDAAKDSAAPYRQEKTPMKYIISDKVEEAGIWELLGLDPTLKCNKKFVRVAHPWPTNEREYEETVSRMMSEKVQYGAIIDAGSSGSRIYLYKWIERFDKHGVTEMLEFQPQQKPDEPEKPVDFIQRKATIECITTKAVERKDGLAGVPHDDIKALKNHLEPLLNHVREALRAEAGLDTSRSNTGCNPVPDLTSTVLLRILATGGMREARERNGISYKLLVDAVTKYINASGFKEPSYETIDGEYEGIYGWIAANLDQKRLRSDLDFTGFLEMGGQTAQIAFVPKKERLEKYEDSLTMITLGRVPGEIKPLEYHVFAKSWSALGAAAMRQLHLIRLLEAASRNLEKNPNLGRCPDFVVKDPCSLSGSVRSYRKDQFGVGLPSRDMKVEGTGDLIACVKAAFDILPCRDSACRAGRPCLSRGLGGCLVSGIPGFDLSEGGDTFVGASVFWHATGGLYASSGGKHSGYNIVTLWTEAYRRYKATWPEVVAQNPPGPDVRPEEHEQRLYDALFRAGLVMATLHLGFGVPMPDHAKDCLDLAMRWFAEVDLARVTGVDPTKTLVDDVIGGIVGTILKSVKEDVNAALPETLRFNSPTYADSWLETEAQHFFQNLLDTVREISREQYIQILQQLLTEIIHEVRTAGSDVNSISSICETSAGRTALERTTTFLCQMYLPRRHTNDSNAQDESIQSRITDDADTTTASPTEFELMQPILRELEAIPSQLVREFKDWANTNSSLMLTDSEKTMVFDGLLPEIKSKLTQVFFEKLVPLSASLYQMTFAIKKTVQDLPATFDEFQRMTLNVFKELLAGRVIQADAALGEFENYFELADCVVVFLEYVAQSGKYPDQESRLVRVAAGITLIVGAARRSLKRLESHEHQLRKPFFTKDEGQNTVSIEEKWTNVFFDFLTDILQSFDAFRKDMNRSGQQQATSSNSQQIAQASTSPQDSSNQPQASSTPSQSPDEDAQEETEQVETQLADSNAQLVVAPPALQEATVSNTAQQRNTTVQRNIHSPFEPLQETTWTLGVMTLMAVGGRLEKKSRRAWSDPETGVLQ